jgi:hypothetical protein
VQRQLVTKVYKVYTHTLSLSLSPPHTYTPTTYVTQVTKVKVRAHSLTSFQSYYYLLLCYACSAGKRLCDPGAMILSEALRRNSTLEKMDLSGVYGGTGGVGCMGDGRRRGYIFGLMCVWMVVYNDDWK